MRNHPLLRLLAVFACLGVVLVTSAQANCDLQSLFASATTITIGPNPTGIISADINGDGKLDLVIGVSSYFADNGASGRIVVLLGHGDGTFSAPVSHPLPGAPWRMRLVDLNGDGIPDLVVTCRTGNTLAVMLGTGSGGVGDGGFAAPVTYPAGNGPADVVVGDFDHDGHLDVAVSDNGSATVVTLRGNGAGGFSPMASYTIPNLATGMETADLDGDGYLDLVVCVDYAQAVAVLKGQAGGTFAPAVPYFAGILPYDVGIRDWDGDGHLDLMVSNGSNGGMQLLPGFGDGTFGAPRQIFAGNCALVLPVDVDGNGTTDLVSSITSNNPGPMTVSLSDGHGHYTTPSQYPIGRIASTAAAGDFNGDGRVDVAIPGFLDDYVSILLGHCVVAPESPVITSVRDVPNDQGGRLFMTWSPSTLDVTAGLVTSYRVWRRIPPAMALARLRRDPSAMSVIRTTPARSASTQIDYWEALATLPAQRLSGYGYTAPTPQDSMPGSNPYSVFFVTAATDDPDLYYDSAPDSGYSVDNLAPFPPQGLVATLAGSGAAVHWHPNGEGDLAGYRLYRGNDPGFVPSAANLVAALSDTGYTDPSGGPGNVYKLIAVDVHGNASAASSAAINMPTAVTATALPPQVSVDAVTLEWQVVADGPVTVQRGPDGMSWSTVATVAPDGAGIVRWTDHTVSAATTYHYQLAVAGPGGAEAAGQIEVRVPGYQLALAGVRPNPLVEGAFAVRFTLGSDARARLDVVDVGGRRVASLEVGDLGAGSHVVDLDRAGRLPAGLYVIRLSSAGRVLSAKAIVMR